MNEKHQMWLDGKIPDNNPYRVVPEIMGDNYNDDYKSGCYLWVEYCCDYDFLPWVLDWRERILKQIPHSDVYMMQDKGKTGRFEVTAFSSTWDLEDRWDPTVMWSRDKV